MRARRAALLMLLAMAIATPAHSQAVKLAPPSLGGAVYVVSSGSGSANAVSGYKAFVSLTGGNNPWQGPAITDQYGRFFFYGLQSGTYLLRIYDPNGTRVWQQVVQAPGTVPQIVIKPSGTSH